MPIKKTKDRVPQVLAATRTLTNTELLVGIPEDNTERDEGPATNAFIGYVQEHGAPEINLPARPFLVPGVQNARDDIVQVLRNAASAALEGQSAGYAKAGLTAAGIIAVNSVVARIRSNIPPPLSPRTIANRRRRTPGSTYRRKATTAADVIALIDTGQLLRSITWVLRKRR